MTTKKTLHRAAMTLARHAAALAKKSHHGTKKRGKKKGKKPARRKDGTFAKRR